MSIRTKACVEQKLQLDLLESPLNRSAGLTRWVFSMG